MYLGQVQQPRPQPGNTGTVLAVLGGLAALGGALTYAATRKPAPLRGAPRRPPPRTCCGR